MPLQLFAPTDGEPPDPGPTKRKPVNLPKFLRPSQADDLLAFVRAQHDVARTPSRRCPDGCPSKIAAAIRDEVIVCLGLFCGLRISELCKLDVDHVDLAERSLLVSQGKGSKDRYVPIAMRIVALLRSYLNGRTSGPFLINDRGERLYDGTIYIRIVRLGRLMKLPFRLHPHTLRHTYACRLLSTGADLREVQELLGHTNLATTAVYLHCDTSRLRAAVDRL